MNIKVIKKIEDIEENLDIAVVHGNTKLAGEVKIRYPSIRLFNISQQVSDDYAMNIAKGRLNIKDVEIKPRKWKKKD